MQARAPAKRALKTGVWILTAAVVLLFAGLAAPVFSEPEEGADHRPEEIQVLLSSDTNIYATGLAGIQATMRVPLRINYLDALSQAEVDIGRYFRRLERRGDPLVITIGPRATRVALEHLRKTPVLFSMVHSPRTYRPAKVPTCGVSLDISIAEYFRALKEVAPNARNVRAFYSTDENEFLVGEGEYLDLRHGLAYTRQKITRRERLRPALEKMSDVDAVYMISDPLYDQERFEQLSRYCRDNSIVLMTSFAPLVRAGATFGIAPNYGRTGVLTGEMANRILGGESSCAGEGVGFVDQTSFYLNEEYASASGLILADSVKERARLTRLFNAGFNFVNQDKLDSARIVFDAILERDPDHGPALAYRRLVVERQTGERTSALLSAARASHAAQRYDLAARDYRRVMRIHPGHEAAGRGLRKALLARSEVERRRGLDLLRSGDAFAAIKMFQAALRSFPGNGAAGRDLARARASQAARLPNFTRTGIALYNSREYARAIRIFENILLIRPGHGQATEYLRLSRKKHAAIQKLLRRQ